MGQMTLRDPVPQITIRGEKQHLVRLIGAKRGRHPGRPRGMERLSDHTASWFDNEIPPITRNFLRRRLLARMCHQVVEDS